MLNIYKGSEKMKLVRYACSGSIIPGYEQRLDNAKRTLDMVRLKTILGAIK